MLFAMAGIDLTTAQTHLQAALAAQLKVLQLGQAVGHDGRQYTRADLKAIREDIQFWQGQIRDLSRTSGPRVQQVIIRG